MEPDDVIDMGTAFDPYETPEIYLLAMAKNLRACQRAYMADRGNDAKGAAVGDAAKKLDRAIEIAEPYIIPEKLG